jgi:hypothetical protein
MNENESLFQITNDGAGKIVDKIKTGVQKYLIFIVLIFNIALQVVARLYRFGLQNPFTAEFFLELAVNVATSMLCYVCFIPFGRSEEQKRASGYSELVKKWETLTANVRKGFIEMFQMFCKDQVTQEQQDKKQYIILSNTMLTMERYKAEFEQLSKAELKDLYKQGKITKTEYKAIYKANYKVKVKSINPLIVLSGVKKATINDAGRTDKAYLLTWLTTRPLIMFTSTAILNAITTTFIGGGENVILDMLFSVLTIVIASVCGYSAGVTDFKNNQDRVESRVLFLSLFHEKNNIKIDK